jgi:hypothetical protein
MLPLKPAGSISTDGDNFGQNNFAAKQALIEQEANGTSLDDINEVGTIARKFFGEQLPKAARNTINGVKSALTPAFVQRMAKTKIHLQEIQHEERFMNQFYCPFLFLIQFAPYLYRNLDYLQENITKTIEQEYNHHKEERQRAKLIRQMMEARKHLRAEKKTALVEADKAHIEEEFRRHHKRRELQMAEQNVCFVISPFLLFFLFS